MGEVGIVVDPCKAVSLPIMWMQVIHSGNAKNRLRNGLKRIPFDKVRHFSLGSNWRSLL
jgi:hypothetical protein